MVDNELRRIISEYIREVCHISQMQVFATSSYQKNYFQVQIDNRIEEMIQQIHGLDRASSKGQPHRS